MPFAVFPMMCQAKWGCAGFMHQVLKQKRAANHRAPVEQTPDEQLSDTLMSAEKYRTLLGSYKCRMAP